MTTTSPISWPALLEQLCRGEVMQDHQATALMQAWLNGVKTIDVVHKGGPREGSIGFELCHGQKHTILDVKTLMLREMK